MTGKPVNRRVVMSMGMRQRPLWTRNQRDLITGACAGPAGTSLDSGDGNGEDLRRD
jgi:hypothetical protein